MTRSSLKMNLLRPAPPGVSTSAVIPDPNIICPLPLPLECLFILPLLQPIVVHIPFKGCVITDLNLITKDPLFRFPILLLRNLESVLPFPFDLFQDRRPG